uniref:Branchpoint-bridging protein n=1 Tax=Anthurium amnicola TaxID=1678845 RepID=A0A1D1YTH6_9ARAE
MSSSGNNEETDSEASHCAEKRSAGSSHADQFPLHLRKKSKQEQSSKSESYFEVPSDEPGQEKGISKVYGPNESSSKRQENAGSAGKRKHSRWDDAPQTDEQNVDRDVVTKRRKTRWAYDDSQLKVLGPVHLPDFAKVSNIAATSKFLKLNQHLLEVNQKLQSHQFADEQEYAKLAKNKRKLIGELIQINPTFDLPPVIKQQKVYKKLYIPTKEYPEYNFIGLILGPRGRTQKRMETETGARILIRGKGSIKNGNPDPSDEEDLHVFVEADSQKSLDAAVAMVEKLLVPVEDGKNKLKLSQLRELAELNNTLRGEKTQKAGEIASKTDDQCGICGDRGHYTVACPLSGKLLETKTHENAMNLLAPVEGAFSPFTVPHLPGNQPPSFRPAMNSVCLGGDKFHRDVDYANLYVAHLPQYVDVNMLVQLFSPFGALSSAQVIRDKSTGLSKGYGFLKYVDAANALMAVSRMNGYMIDGNMLAVRVADKGHSTPGCVQSAEHSSFGFPSAYQMSSSTAHIPAPTCWPGPPGSLPPGTYDLTYSSYGLPCTSPMPSSLISVQATPDEIALFPGNPDKFASGRPSLFS